MIINKQKEIQIINNCEAIFDEQLLIRAILWYSEKPVSRIKNVYLYSKYPCVSIYDNKIHIHRLIFMYLNETDLNSGEHIHHIDGNRLNAESENLELINASKHMSYHNKGKTLSLEHRAKIGNANKRRKGNKYKKSVHIPRQELMHLINDGDSINGIAKHFGCDWSTIKSRISEL